MASDGRWYPPELHPAVRSAGQAAALPIPQGQSVGPAQFMGQVQVQSVPQAQSVAGYQSAPNASQTVPTGFDNNPFAVNAGLFGPTPTKKKGHLAMPLLVLLILAIVGAASAVGYMLTHPSPQRSADSAALDFYEKLGSSPANYTAALSDVLPSQRAQAASMGSLQEVQSVVQQIGSLNLSVANPGPATGPSKTVVIKGCNETLSCSPVSVSVPTAEMNGKWYVNFTAWDALAQQQVH